MNARQIVERAIELLIEKGWCQNLYHELDGSLCIHGAMNLAEIGTPLPSDLMSEPQYEIRRALAKRLGVYSASTWNDEPERTKDEVIALLKDVYAELPL